MWKLLIEILIVASVIFVYYDATKNKIGKIPGRKSFANLSAGWWCVVVSLLWPVTFPLYLIKRKKLIELARENPQEPSSWRRFWVGFMVVQLILFVALSLFVESRMPGVRDMGMSQVSTIFSGELESVSKRIAVPKTGALKEPVIAGQPSLKKVATVTKKSLKPVSASKKKTATREGRTSSGVKKGEYDSAAIAADIKAVGKNPLWVERSEAARRLGKAKVEGVVDALILALENDANPFVRREAALSLGKIGDRRAVEALERALNTDSDPFVRKYAWRALEMI